MRAVFISLCAVFGVVVGYMFVGNASAKAYFLGRLPAAISQAFFPHNTEGEKEKSETKESVKGVVPEDAYDAAVVVDEEARLQQSIKSVEDEIRRTEEFLEKKGAH